MKDYEREYKRSVDPATKDAFWAEQANGLLDWITPFRKVRFGGFEVGDAAWFVGGQLPRATHAN